MRTLSETAKLSSDLQSVPSPPPPSLRLRCAPPVVPTLHTTTALLRAAAVRTAKPVLTHKEKANGLNVSQKEKSDPLREARRVSAPVLPSLDPAVLAALRGALEHGRKGVRTRELLGPRGARAPRGQGLSPHLPALSAGGRCSRCPGRLAGSPAPSHSTPATTGFPLAVLLQKPDSVATLKVASKTSTPVKFSRAPLPKPPRGLLLGCWEDCFKGIMAAMSYTFCF